MAPALSLHMPPDVAANANLATQVVSTDAPSWAIAHDAVHPLPNGYFEVMGSRTYQDIFRLPNLGSVVRKWLFTRPAMEAISEDSFANSAAESMTLFRIEGVDNEKESVMITPTVSSHCLLVPCQTINGYTVGLAYMDITYERDSYSIKDNRVPPLRLGRFVLDDATGEMFCSAWTGNIMVVAWVQSIIKCERVRELLLFEAPPDGTAPRNLILRNSFFERRSCALCGLGSSITTLPPPCSGVSNRRLSQDPTQTPMLTNIASLYRRFRGSFFGVVLKTRYGDDRLPQAQQLVPIFVDMKLGLHTVKVGFKSNLRKNIDIVLGGASNDGYFGVNPRSSCTRSLLLLRASNPVVAEAVDTSPNDGCAAAAGSSVGCVSAVTGANTSGNGVIDSDCASRPSLDSRQRSSSPSSVIRREGSVVSMDREEPEVVGVPRRRRSEDPLQRDSIVHKRKVRNRISAQRSNKLRKLRLESKKSELADLKTRLPQLRDTLDRLQKENMDLRIRVFGPDSIAVDEGPHFDWLDDLKTGNTIAVGDFLFER